jgi:hypothetical protein
MQCVLTLTAHRRALAPCSRTELKRRERNNQKKAALKAVSFSFVFASTRVPVNRSSMSRQVATRDVRKQMHRMLPRLDDLASLVDDDSQLRL